MSDHLNIAVNPQILVWAREEGGYDVERVAARLQVKEERVYAWERGERQPTIRQVEELARFLHRPLGVFFLSKTPQLAPLAAEYRRLPDVEPGQESPELRLAIRQMVARRETTLNLMGELGAAITPFRLVAHLRENVADIGQRIREATGVSPEQQFGWRDQWEAWRRWREGMDNLGVLVFQFPKVALREVRGLSLLRTPLPVAAINSKEIPEARSFTLFHEVTHLMLAAAQEELSAAKEQRTGEAWLEMERFAERVAGHVLMPDPMLETVLRALPKVPDDWTLDEVRHLARQFRTTPLATATRLREFGAMSWDQYRSWRAQWDAYVATLPVRKGGFASPTATSVSRAGRPFVQLVLEAMDSNRITPVEASRYLGLKYRHFEALREQVAHGVGDGDE